MINLIEFIGALSLNVTLSFYNPAFLCGSSLLSPILTKVLLEACLHPSTTILRAIYCEKLDDCQLQKAFV